MWNVILRSLPIRSNAMYWMDRSIVKIVNIYKNKWYIHQFSDLPQTVYITNVSIEVKMYFNCFFFHVAVSKMSDISITILNNLCGISPNITHIHKDIFFLSWSLCIFCTTTFVVVWDMTTQNILSFSLV